MNRIKVSVIIPTYKRSQDILRAVESVLSQSIDSFEVIVVDDNGIGTIEGEKTAEIMQKYANDKRLTYIRHEHNLNGAVARNTGIKRAVGEYIAFLDDDDAFFPERLQKMYECLEGCDLEWGACYSGYIKHLKNYDQYSAEVKSGDLYVQALMRSLYIGSGSNLFFRKKVVDEIGLFNENFKRNQDLEYLIRVLKKYKMAYVDDVLLEIHYDIRQKPWTKEQWNCIEQAFYESFKPYLNGLSAIDKQRVQCMYSIDELRHAIGYKDWNKVCSLIVKRDIPMKVLLRYVMYVINRWHTKTCYGFIP